MSVADTSGGASTPTSGALPPGLEVVKNTHSNDLPANMLQCSVFSVQCSVFSVQCSEFSVQCSVFSVQCSVFSSQDSEFKVLG